MPPLKSLSETRITYKNMQTIDLKKIPFDVRDGDATMCLRYYYLPNPVDKSVSLATVRCGVSFTHSSQEQKHQFLAHFPYLENGSIANADELFLVLRNALVQAYPKCMVIP